MATPWQKQTDQPLFEDFFWQLPQTKRTRGKLIIVGGSGQQFSAVSAAHQATTQAMAGYIDLALPSSLNTIIPSDPRTHFLPCTKTNAISANAAGDLRQLALAADAVLVAGDVGRSNQTSQALAALMMSTETPVTITGDAIGLFNADPHVLLDRKQNTLILSFGQLQKLLGGKTSNPITSDMGLVLLVRALQELSLNAAIITKFQEKILVLVRGEVSATDHTAKDDWSLQTASVACVFAMQQPASHFAALTSAVYLVVSGKNLQDVS